MRETFCIGRADSDLARTQRFDGCGQALFNQIGCALCHSPTLVTNQQNGNGAAGGAENTLFNALAGVTFHPYSDFAVHHMGSNLADGVSQGGAGPDQFRSAPLWGLGQRIFFLHDGRTTNLLTAIADHRSNGSEATQVAENFASLSAGQQQEVLNFLRSL